MEDSKRRFTATADAYARYRPSYTRELALWIAGGVPSGGRIADIGCGTGITTRVFGREGFRVFGIDPNETMLARARAEGGLFVRAEASRTGLRSRSMDLVIAGQAFHWFATDEALFEFARILKRGSPAAVFWNERGASPFMDAYEALLLDSSAEYQAIPRAAAAMAFLRASPRVRGREERTFPNRQVMDWEAFLGRVNSSSYVAHGIADREAFDRRLLALFRAHASLGRVEFVYETIAARFTTND